MDDGPQYRPEPSRQILKHLGLPTKLIRDGDRGPAGVTNRFFFAPAGKGPAWDAAGYRGGGPGAPGLGGEDGEGGEDGRFSDAIAPGKSIRGRSLSIFVIGAKTAMMAR